ncbi:MAG: hypothetical protein COA94_08635 [Rickettsiales bacterium]|nr:MAG: hypothetical protein COA94_08635 [Rickettsiales bacterium]
MSNKQTNTIIILALMSFVLLVTSVFTGYRYFKWRLSYQRLAHEYSYRGEVIHPKTTQEIIDTTFSGDWMVQEIYQMLKDTTELFEKFEIKYAVESGTALGVIRHGGFIPWDDDVDIMLMQEDEHKLIELAPELEKLGYKILWDEDVYRIFLPNKLVHPEMSYTLPAIDINIMFENKEKNTVEMVNWNMRKLYSKVWFPRDKFFPLKKYKFGPIEVYGPSDIEWHVKHYYGKNALKEIRMDPKIWLGKHSNIITVPSPVPDVFFKPALPKKPLLDNVN